jgi:hypothetical protein
MDVGSRLRRRWYLVILAAIIALVVGATTVLKVGHGHLKVKRSVYRVAIGQVLVDTNPSTLTNTTGASRGLAGRAQLISEYATGPRIVARIASQVGVPVSSLTVQVQSTNSTKTGKASSKDLAVGSGKDSVLLRSTGEAQTITVTGQSHSDATAKALVTATISSLRRSLRLLQNAQAYNHVTTPTTTTTSSTTTTTAKSTKPGSKSAAASRAAAAAKRAAAANRAAKAAQAAAAQHARSVDLSKIVLRPLGGVTVSKVVVSAKKSKAVAYVIGAFIVLVLLILLLDNLLTSSARVPATVAPPSAPSDDVRSDD